MIAEFTAAWPKVTFSWKIALFVHFLHAPVSWVLGKHLLHLPDFCFFSHACLQFEVLCFNVFTNLFGHCIYLYNFPQVYKQLFPEKYDSTIFYHLILPHFFGIQLCHLILLYVDIVSFPNLHVFPALGVIGSYIYRGYYHSTKLDHTFKENAPWSVWFRTVFYKFEKL